jgi:hypothetical protein
MARRPLWIGALVVVAGLLAGLLLMRPAPAPPPPAEPVAKLTATPAPVAAAPSPTASPQRYTLRTESHLPPIDESQITAKQAAAAAERYRKAARFPLTSRPLEDGIDPIANSRMPKSQSEGEDTPEPRLITYPSVTNFEAPGEIVLYGEVVQLRKLEQRPERDHRGDRPPDVRRFRVATNSMRGVIQNADAQVVATVDFHDDGTHGDAEAGDQLFTTTYTPDPDDPKGFRGEYQVDVLAQTAEGADLTARTSFVYSVQKAHLTGQYKDSLDDGNLKIEAEVEVEEAGRFRVESTLVRTSDAKMITYGYADADLPPGRHWIPVKYYGLAFHVMKAEGPYSMFSVVLSEIGGSTVEGDVVPNAHTTAAYKLSDFNDQPYNEPSYTQKAEYYEALARSKQ